MTPVCGECGGNTRLVIYRRNPVEYWCCQDCASEIWNKTMHSNIKRGSRMLLQEKAYGKNGKGNVRPRR